MKRQALLFGNTTAAGAQNDLLNWKKFLESGRGGAWKDYEIQILSNPSKAHLQAWLKIIKDGGYDFVLVAYAGHGGWERSTILEINPDGETINEVELKGLAPREILSLDCCRGTGAETQIVDEALEKSFSADTFSNIRARYDSRMMRALPQQVTLYACSIGESAYCTNDGGYYTKNLLKQSSATPANQFITINQAHYYAAQATKNEVLAKENRIQTPDIACARCLTDQQLIIGIDTSVFRIY